MVAAGLGPARLGNQGRAQVWDRVAALRNLRPEASPNLGIFRTGPWPGATLSLRLLERHARSTQLFVPLRAARTLFVVAPPDAFDGGALDPGAVRAFVAGPDQGVTYHPGTWHHPLVALDAPGEHLCLVWEAGTAEDCEIREVGGVEVEWGEG